MPQGPRMELSGIVLESPDARELAGFYQRLLTWEVGQDDPVVKLRPRWRGAVIPDRLLRAPSRALVPESADVMHWNRVEI